MTITAVCRKCGETFRKMSIKSTDKICPDCKGTLGRNRYKVMTNNTMNAIGTLENLDKKVAELTRSIDILHSTIAVEVQHQITKGLEPIIEKLIEEKDKELKDIVVSSMTKSRRCQEQVLELTKIVKQYKSSNTRMKNEMKKFKKIMEEYK